MNEIIWKDYDTSTALYINGKRCATIYPQNIPGSKPEQKRYVMDLHYCNHNLHAENMEQAKNATLMLVLRDMEFHYKEYKQKAEDLHDAIRAINTTARFSQSDIVFEDIVIDTDNEGLSCQSAGPIMGKLEEVFGLKAEEGVWYNLYLCYKRSTESVHLICTVNNDTSSTEQEIETTQHERAMLRSLLREYVVKETGAPLYELFAAL